SFFFYYSVHLRYLHSFPTRRSSDLLIWNGFNPHAFAWVGLPGSTKATTSRVVLFLPLAALQPSTKSNGAKMHCIMAARFMCQKRSEEHTSELQSRGHLVCRLLLEKK